jgi:hypothetical protein
MSCQDAHWHRCAIFSRQQEMLWNWQNARVRVERDRDLGVYIELARGYQRRKKWPRRQAPEAVVYSITRQV